MAVVDMYGVLNHLFSVIGFTVNTVFHSGTAAA